MFFRSEIPISAYEVFIDQGMLSSLAWMCEEDDGLCASCRPNWKHYEANFPIII